MLFKTDGYKINFIDSNDVYVGYDISQSCCECAGWFVHDEKLTTDEKLYEIDLDGGYPDFTDWVGFDFDPSFGEMYSVMDAGGVAIFKMVRNDEIKYLHIYNAHNGYYGHGFYSNTILGDGGL